MKSPASSRSCAVCGMFYPGDPAELHETVASLVGGLTMELAASRTVRGVIVPHAGYLYSGATAAAAYARLAGRTYGTVVIVAPSHREAFQGVSVFPGEAYETPLGRVQLDAGMREELLAAGFPVHASLAGHRSEHAIEVQLPFLQEVLGGFLLVPLVVGDQSRRVCFALGELLGSACAGRDVLLVASTDLSHYLPAEAAEALDRVAREDIARCDPEALMADLQEGRTEACGGGPVVAVLQALRMLGATRMEIVHHCSSGDVTGDRRSVVGYCSALAWDR